MKDGKEINKQDKKTFKYLFNSLNSLFEAYYFAIVHTGGTVMCFPVKDGLIRSKNVFNHLLYEVISREKRKRTKYNFIASQPLDRLVDGTNVKKLDDITKISCHSYYAVQDGYQAVFVTCGTDSRWLLPMLSYFTHLKVPIVVVRSMEHPSAKKSDAQSMVRQSLEIAKFHATCKDRQKKETLETVVTNIEDKIKTNNPKYVGIYKDSTAKKEGKYGIRDMEYKFKGGMTIGYFEDGNIVVYRVNPRGKQKRKIAAEYRIPINLITTNKPHLSIYYIPTDLIADINSVNKLKPDDIKEKRVGFVECSTSTTDMDIIEAIRELKKDKKSQANNMIFITSSDVAGGIIDLAVYVDGKNTLEVGILPNGLYTTHQSKVRAGFALGLEGEIREYIKTILKNDHLEYYRKYFLEKTDNTVKMQVINDFVAYLYLSGMHFVNENQPMKHDLKKKKREFYEEIIKKVHEFDINKYDLLRLIPLQFSLDITFKEIFRKYTTRKIKNKVYAGDRINITYDSNQDLDDLERKVRITPNMKSKSQKFKKWYKNLKQKHFEFRYNLSKQYFGQEDVENARKGYTIEVLPKINRSSARKEMQTGSYKKAFERGNTEELIKDIHERNKYSNILSKHSKQ